MRLLDRTEGAGRCGRRRGGLPTLRRWITVLGALGGLFATAIVSAPGAVAQPQSDCRPYAFVGVRGVRGPADVSPTVDFLEKQVVPELQAALGPESLTVQWVDETAAGGVYDPPDFTKVFGSDVTKDQVRRSESGQPEPLTGESRLPPGLHSNEQNGAAVTADHIRTQATLCPDQHFVLAGYSEGAWVLGDALADPTLGPLHSRIDQVLLFGDPMFDSRSPAVRTPPGHEGSRTALGVAARALGPRAQYVPADLVDRAQSYCWSGLGAVDPICASYWEPDGGAQAQPSGAVGRQEWAHAMRLCGVGLGGTIAAYAGACGHLRYADLLAGSDRPWSRNVTVSSTTAGWRDTGLHVGAGQTVTVRPVAGSWTVDYRMFARVGPEGYGPDTDHTVLPGCKIDEDEPYGALLAGVAVGGDPSHVGGVSGLGHGEGTDGSYTAQADGTLLLHVNDQDRCLGDNAGLLTVTVTEARTG
ncbi:cutinase family protein [Kitasatospora sp. NPDC056181]|uniref:cutinase family protein n=1 Tax=Kitasatospora sp. NPDC056181 TaxID=3345737 RepID=UPI0035DFE9D3